MMATTPIDRTSGTFLLNQIGFTKFDGKSMCANNSFTDKKNTRGIWHIFIPSEYNGNCFRVNNVGYLVSAIHIECLAA